MRARIFAVTALLLSPAPLQAAAGSPAALPAARSLSPSRPAWMDTSLSPDARASAIPAAMTLEEKLAMVSGGFGGEARKGNLGETRIGAGFVPCVARLGIPPLLESDGALGVANGDYLRPGDVATAMPSNLAVGASFDPAMARSTGAAIGAEARAKGFNVLLAGGVNLIRDPWSGRSFEYVSEVSLLSGTMVGESIAGIQSNGIISTLKHLALNA